MTIEELLLSMGVGSEFLSKAKRRIEGSRLLRKIVSILLPLLDGDETDAEMEGMFAGGMFQLTPSEIHSMQRSVRAGRRELLHNPKSRRAGKRRRR